MASKSQKKAKPILCIECRHFKITWQPSHPRACSAMGFKTKNWPCYEVLASSGEPCLKFSPKPKNDNGNNKKPIDNKHISLKV
ncbi:MAG: hypothetical protein HQL71_15330 [Magnetococcales bacterium]|nr:hypothetical protein [Magnetococcales bacterium]